MSDGLQDFLNNENIDVAKEKVVVTVDGVDHAYDFDELGLSFDNSTNEEVKTAVTGIFDEVFNMDISDVDLKISRLHSIRSFVIHPDSPAAN